MTLYFHETLRRLRMSASEFFDVAYQWKFNPPRLPMLHDDKAQYLLHGVLPRYVCEYLQHLQK